MSDEKYQDGLRLLGGFHALRGRENDIMRKLVAWRKFFVKNQENEL
jgi:hypothetical protein